MAQDFVFDWWSVVIVLGIVHGFIVALALFLNKKGKPATLMLALLVLVLLWHHLQSISIYLNFFKSFPHFYGADLGSLFLIGPLFYLYIGFVTSSRQKLKPRDTFHFLPFLLTIIIHPVIFLSGQKKVQLIIDWLTATRYDNPHLRQAFLADDIIFALESVHMIIYFALAVFVLHKYSKSLKQFLSSYHQQHYKWLLVLTISMLVVISVSFILQKSLYLVLKYYYYSLDYIYILPMTLFIYVLGFYGLRSPILFSHNLDFRRNEDKYRGSSLTNEKAEQLRNQLELYLEEKKPYLVADITLADMADYLEIPSNHLSQVINEKLGFSFFDLINTYRINEAKRRLQDDAYRADKLLKIAYDCGFSNKVSFNNYFKKLTGVTPSDYRKKYQ